MVDAGVEGCVVFGVDLLGGGLDGVFEGLEDVSCGVLVSAAELDRFGVLDRVDRVEDSTDELGASVVVNDELGAGGGAIGLLSVMLLVPVFGLLNSQKPSATSPATTTAPIAAGTFHLPFGSSSSPAAPAGGGAPSS